MTLHYDRMMLLLDPTPLARGLVGKKVEVVNYPDGQFAVQFNGTALDFKVFDKIQTVQPGAIVDNKTAVSRVGADQGAAGRLSGASAARARCAAATAEQPSRHRVCRQRGGHHATVLPQLLPCIPLRNGIAGRHRAMARVGF